VQEKKTFIDLFGKHFVLYPDVWEHIISGHPEMIDKFNRLSTILSDPIYIFRSKRFYNRHLYYKQLKFKLYFVVVTDVVQNTIKTAYITDRIKEGELIWQKQE